MKSTSNWSVSTPVFRISAYTSPSYAQFDVLFRDTFGYAMPEAVFDWKYGRNPHGPGTLWVATEGHSDTWLGALALFPRRFRYGAESLVCGQLADGMVSRSARRRGIFSQLLDRVWTEHRALGYDLLFGLCEADGMSVHGLRKAMFLHEIGRFRGTIRVLSPAAVNRRVPTVPGRWLAGVAASAWLAWHDGAGSDAACVQEDAFAAEESGFVVDEDWVRWRISAPGKPLRAYAWPGGGAILRDASPVAEIRLLRTGGSKRGLTGLLGRLREEGFERAVLSARIPPKESAILRSSGFLTRHRQDSLVMFAGATSWDDGFLRQFSEMWVAGGDLDVP